MLDLLAENGGTILVLAVLTAIVLGIVLSMRRAKRTRTGGCGCGCAGCPSRGICHPEK